MRLRGMVEVALGLRGDEGLGDGTEVGADEEEDDEEEAAVGGSACADADIGFADGDAGGDDGGDVVGPNALA